MRSILLDKLPLLYAALAAEGPLYLPAEEGGRVDFAPWREGATVNLKEKTLKSGKDFFFPQTEDIVSFKTAGQQIEIFQRECPDHPFVVFGMRGCDAAGLGVLDRVFLAEPKDSFYETRRKAGVIVSLACSLPDESCFCTSIGVDPAAPAGDVAVWTAGDRLYWKAGTEKGEALTSKLGRLLEAADEAGQKAVAAEREKIARLVAESPFQGLEMPAVAPEGLSAWFDSPEWAGLSEACLGCGACTFVCPTCQCYDIQDRDDGQGVRRFRCWDSCMYSDFTLMAHGNPRTTQLQRFRQRFMHKLVYFPQNNDGMYSCVGCGRCVERCPAGLNIVKVIKAMKNTEVNADV